MESYHRKSFFINVLINMSNPFPYRCPSSLSRSLRLHISTRFIEITIFFLSFFSNDDVTVMDAKTNHQDVYVSQSILQTLQQFCRPDNFMCTWQRSRELLFGSKSFSFQTQHVSSHVNISFRSSFILRMNFLLSLLHSIKWCRQMKENILRRPVDVLCRKRNGNSLNPTRISGDLEE